MSLAIRPAEPRDAGLIAALIRNLAEDEKLAHEALATEADITRDLFGANPRVFADIAEWHGAPVGFALWFYNFSTFQGRHGIYLEDLYVEPEHRGNGIGKALLARLAKRCVDEGCTRLQWWVLDWNAPAIGFYKAMGAVPQDEWTVMRVSGDALRRLGGGESLSILRRG